MKQQVEVDATGGIASGRTASTGNTGIEILFDLKSPLPDGTVAIDGTLWLSKKTEKDSKQTMTEVGIDPDPTKHKSEGAFFDAFTGKKFSLTCELEPPNDYHERDKWVVRSIRPRGVAPRRKAAEPGSVFAALGGSVAPQPSLLDADDVGF